MLSGEMLGRGRAGETEVLTIVLVSMTEIDRAWFGAGTRKLLYHPSCAHRVCHWIFAHGSHG